MIFSYEIEKQVLCGILQHQHKWEEIAAFIKESDFYSKDSKINISIFKLLRHALDNAESIDETILIQRIQQLKVTFPDCIDVSEYVFSLAFFKISEEVFLSSVKELKKFSARRQIYDSCKEVAAFVKKTDPNLKYSEIVEKADQLYNKTIRDFEMSEKGPVNLFEIMEPMIEERGNNPVTDFGLMGPHPRINELYGSLLRAGNISVVCARSGAGKAQSVNCRVFTPEGPKAIGTMKVGDLVMGEDGLPKKILGVYPQGKKKSYKVTMSDGSFTHSCDEHLWTVQTSHGRCKKTPYKTIPLKEIIDDKLYTKCGAARPNGKPKYSIPLARPVQFNKKELPLHPYFLGLLLGDGCFARKDKVLFTTADPEIVEKISEILPETDQIKARTQKYQYAIVKKENFKKNEEFGNFSTSTANIIQTLGLEGKRARTKSIPEPYLYSDVEDRIQLLRGLMDSDGSASCVGGGQCHFTSISKDLIYGLRELVHGLGGRCRIDYTKSRDIYCAKIILFDQELVPFFLSRKVEKFRICSERFRKRFISKIEYQGIEDSVCIKIDSPTELYLTDDYIVTHNTSFALDFATKVSSMNNNVPVLHFDNGEMSEEELVMRQMSAMTGLPMFLFETGKWRTSSYKDLSSKEVVDLVRHTFSKIKDMKFYYENVAGLSPDDMASTLKRFYYSKVGRGNPMVFSFDYIKSDFGNTNGKDGWQQVAYLVHRLKQCIHRELCFDGKPAVSMLTSIQSNRLGITTNRGADALVDDESVVSLSDAVTHFCSHLFLLRKKVAEELHVEGNRFGTHKLINLKARHLGSDPMRAINPVVMPDGTQKNNFINLEFNNFRITEKGDLQDLVNAMNNNTINVEENEMDGIPMILQND